MKNYKLNLFYLSLTLTGISFGYYFFIEKNMYKPILMTSVGLLATTIGLFVSIRKDKI